MTACLAQISSPETGFIASALFYLFAIMAGAAAVGVVVTRNVVRMAVMLMFTLIGVAGLYFLLGAEFLAAVQLVIYAGGTLILIVFGVMLTTKSPFARFEPKMAEVVVAVTIGLVLLGAMILAISPANARFASNPISAGQEYPMARLGQALLGDYVVPFELISVLLLVVMIGAAYLAKARKR
ncbi:MAG: nuoJ [Phycisphaerales bacterium]|nr:nuoJ [Phycisphaerales bacterium]